MPSVFIDTNVPMYAAGNPHPLREPCQRVVTAIVGRQIDAVTDTEAFQEIFHRFFSLRQRGRGLDLFDTFHRIMVGRILPVSDGDLLRARALADRYPRLDPRDLIHLAVMLGAQIEEIITADRAFDEVREVRRIAPEWFVSAN